MNACLSKFLKAIVLMIGITALQVNAYGVELEISTARDADGKCTILAL